MKVRLATFSGPKIHDKLTERFHLLSNSPNAWRADFSQGSSKRQMKAKVLLEAIEETCGSRRSVGRTALQFVARDIEDEEELVAASPAVAKGKRGLLAITRRRVAFYHCNYFGGVNVTQYPVGSVTCVSYDLHLMSGVLRLRVGQDQFCIEGLSRRATTRLSASVHKARMAPTKPPERAGASDAVKMEREDNDLRLQRLYGDGVISRAEYDRLKARLVERERVPRVIPAA